MTFDRVTTQRNRHGIRILVPRRRTAARFESQPAGVREFTAEANHRAQAANRARS